MSPSIVHALRKGFTWRDAVAVLCVGLMFCGLLLVATVMS